MNFKKHIKLLCVVHSNRKTVKSMYGVVFSQAITSQYVVFGPLT